MKKYVVLLSCIVVIILFYCGVQRSNQNEEQIERQNTVTDINFSAAVPAKQNNAVRYTESSLSVATEPIKNDEEQFNESQIVLHGKVLKTDYLLNGSEVYTKSEVEVLKCYKGNLKEGEVIKIREIGGFVPADVYDNAVNVEKFGVGTKTSEKNKTIYDIRVVDNKVMEEGEYVILFVYPVTYSNFDVFKTNSYQLIRAWQGKMLLDETKGVYAPYLPEMELKFVDARSYTLDDFEECINEWEKKEAFSSAVNK